jgi:hypothetical protein
MSIKRNKLLLNIYVVFILVTTLSMNGCRKSHEGLSDVDLFEEFVLSPVPTSVSELRICRPKYYYGQYIMNFKIDTNDVQTILNSRLFVENNNWEFDAGFSVLRWTCRYEMKDPVEESPIKQGIIVHTIGLNKDQNGHYKPDWFRPNEWFGSRLYFCNISNSPTNPNNIIKHVLMYNEKLCEAYYLIDRTGGL